MKRMFDFECKPCKVVEEHIVDYDEKIHCLLCGHSMDKLPPMVNVSMGAAGAHGYFDDTLGKYISTNSQRKEEMRKQGVTEKGETPKPDGDAWV